MTLHKMPWILPRLPVICLAKKKIILVEQKMVKASVPDPIDIEVGHRIRLCRRQIGMSQTELGDRIGVTFQQVQKYEKGTNRVGASRLVRIAGVLRTSVQSLTDTSAKAE